MDSHLDSKLKNIKVVVFLNLLFTVIEIVGGVWTNSLAILSDALHDFGDSVTLISSYILEMKSQQKADNKRTFGYRRLSLISALLTACILTIGSIFMVSRAIPRLINPEQVNASGMILLALIGIVVNGIGMARLKKGASQNEKVLIWHLLEDVMGWVVVLIGSIAMYLWGNPIIDPLMTLGYTVFIIWGVSRNVKETVNIFLQGVPAHIDINHIKSGLLSIPGVCGVHDMHVWSLDGETDIFTGHIVVEDKLFSDLVTTRKVLKEELSKHHIEHSTVEIESVISDNCIEEHK